MQRLMWGRLCALAEAEHRATRGLPPKVDGDLEDPGFWWPPDDVWEAWRALKDFHVLPQAGGWLDQDAWLRDDLFLMDAWYVRAWMDTRPPDRQFNDG